jgi:hypothetical protein
MLKSRFGILIAVFVLFITGAITAQDTTDFPTRDQGFDTEYQQQNGTQDVRTQVYVDDLRTRLNLREDQVQEINDVLTRYNREAATTESTDPTVNNTELQDRYSSEIEAVLDENQKTQWRSYSDQWWNSVKTGREGTEIYQDNRMNQPDMQQDTETQDDMNNDVNQDAYPESGTEDTQPDTQPEIE